MKPPERPPLLEAVLDPAGRGRWLLNVTIAVVTMLLIAGWSLPLFETRQFYIFRDEVSMIGALVELFAAGDWWLWLILLLFSMVVPLLKLVVLFHGYNTISEAGGWSAPAVVWLGRLGRWSMLDVLVIAVLLVAVKSGGLVQLHLRTGIYAFASSVVLMMLLTEGLYRLRRKQQP